MSSKLRWLCGLFVALVVSMVGGALGAAPGSVAEPRMVTVRWEFAVKAAKIPLRGELRLQPKDSATAKPISLAIEGGHPVRVALPAGSLWEASVAAPGFWVRRLVFRVEDTGEPKQVLEAWPMGRLVGRLVLAERSLPLPKRVLVATQQRGGAAQKRPLLEGTSDCPVDPEGRFECRIPSSTFDLRILADSFVSTYAWDVAIPESGEADLKTLTLRRGASLAGWVEPVAGEVVDPERCRVVLTPRVRVDPEDLRAVEEVSRMNREAKVDARGFFQVMDVIPGEYEVHAKQGGAVSDPKKFVDVSKDDETYLYEPFRLEPPLDLEIAVNPAKDWHGKHWVVYLERSGFQPETSVSAFTSEEGIARFPGQNRGSFDVAISDAVGEGRLASRDLFFDAATARRSFQISWVEVKGRIRQGGRPLFADLRFDGADSAVGLLHSDEKGRFSGILIRDGWWLIKVKAPIAGLTLELLRTIEARDGRAEIEIELPDTRIFGRVVDATGHSGAKAMVTVVGSGGAMQWIFADPSGRFEFRGVEPGTLSVGAEARRGGFFSEERSLTLMAGGELGPIELALRAPERFVGQVLSDRGAERRARVTVLGVGPLRYDYVDTRTETDGSFEAEVPTANKNAIAIVGAKGTALKAFEIRSGETATLFVPETGGTVEVDLGTSFARRTTEGDLSLVLFQNGMELPALKLDDWTRALRQPIPRGQVRRFVEVAPAEYSACLIPASAQPDRVRNGSSPKLAVECRSGTLGPGGTLALAFGQGLP